MRRVRALLVLGSVICGVGILGLLIVLLPLPPVDFTVLAALYLGGLLLLFLGGMGSQVVHGARLKRFATLLYVSGMFLCFASICRMGTPSGEYSWQIFVGVELELGIVVLPFILVRLWRRHEAHRARAQGV